MPRQVPITERNTTGTSTKYNVQPQLACTPGSSHIQTVLSWSRFEHTDHTHSTLKGWGSTNSKEPTMVQCGTAQKANTPTSRYSGSRHCPTIFIHAVTRYSGSRLSPRPAVPTIGVLNRRSCGDGGGGGASHNAASSRHRSHHPTKWHQQKVSMGEKVVFYF
jgi:hypothetical protein